jgi:hypothetical protein
MKYYRARKSFIAEPMTEFEYHGAKNGDKKSKYIKDREGYHIILPTKHDQIYPEGLKFWLPKEIFEEFFCEI